MIYWEGPPYAALQACGDPWTAGERHRAGMGLAGTGGRVFTLKELGCVCHPGRRWQLERDAAVATMSPGRLKLITIEIHVENSISDIRSLCEALWPWCHPRSSGYKNCSLPEPALERESMGSTASFGWAIILRLEPGMVRRVYHGPESFWERLAFFSAFSALLAAAN